MQCVHQFFSVFPNSENVRITEPLTVEEASVCLCMRLCGYMAMHNTFRQLPSFETNIIIARG